MPLNSETYYLSNFLIFNYIFTMHMTVIAIVYIRRFLDNLVI